MPRIEPSKRALRIVRERMENMHVEYAHYMNTGADDIPSTGTVANYGGVSGGRTNRTSDFTAMLGIQLASIPPAKAESLRWMDCAWAVFLRGIMPNLQARKLSLPKRQRLATISFVIYYHGFLGHSLASIAQMQMPHHGQVSRQRVGEYWKLAVLEVAMEARRRGLI